MNIKKIVCLGTLLLWLAGCATVNTPHRFGTGHDDSNTANPIDSLNPTSGTYGNAAYPGQLYNFLAKEDANRALEFGFGNFVVSGCLGIVSAGLIMTPSSCIAYNAGFRSTETGAITFANGQTTWVAIDENTSGSNANLPNFTRAGSTHYLIDSTDVTQPVMPSDAQLLMKVTTSGGAITVVTDLRVLTPNFALAVTTLHANLNANGFRITGLGVPAATGDASSEGAPIGAKTPAAGTFTNVTDSALTSGQCVQASTGGLLAVTGAACAAAVPNGSPPQIVGFAAANTPEVETVSGDFAFTRAGANSYTAAVTKVNGNAVSSTAPTAAQIWAENAGATSMVPVSISGDCTIAATGAITCTKINGTTPGGTCTNQFVTAVSSSAVPTCTTATLASAQFANQGTTTTVLHGAAAGNPSFAAVGLTTDVTGTLPIANGGTGTTAGAVVTVTIQKFTASGTYTPHAGILYAIAECVGNGGGGGGCAGSATQEQGGGGGGSGSYSRVRLTAAQIGVSQAVTVGATGTGGTIGNNNGVNGGDVSLGSLCIGKGGTGGTGAAAAFGSAGGAGGVAGTGDITAVGNTGGNGFGSANGNQNGWGGYGGASALGGSAGPNNSATSAAITGPAGGNYGAGGSGGVSVVNATGAAGGNGATGIVIVTEYNSQ